jgi:hypothetical protein
MWDVGGGRWDVGNWRTAEDRVAARGDLEILLAFELMSGF